MITYTLNFLFASWVNGRALLRQPTRRGGLVVRGGAPIPLGCLVFLTNAQITCSSIPSIDCNGWNRLTLKNDIHHHRRKKKSHTWPLQGLHSNLIDKSSQHHLWLWLWQILRSKSGTPHWDPISGHFNPLKINAIPSYGCSKFIP